ncbi:hypothetical protein VIGAN_04311800 [Vigna angularis var. angularis]|uniref:Secreted protein n=1 Tax=Vigna angularis var. angularis TaxID=157739 RepID=A0A0S3RYA7_PHAAN|nr:hypothetical protein VIGAN_04311800 [Vigna angularis var. angularis]
MGAFSAGLVLAGCLPLAGRCFLLDQGELFASSVLTCWTSSSRVVVSLLTLDRDAAPAGRGWMLEDFGCAFA